MSYEDRCVNNFVLIFLLVYYRDHYGTFEPVNGFVMLISGTFRYINQFDELLKVTLLRYADLFSCSIFRKLYFPRANKKTGKTLVIFFLL